MRPLTAQDIEAELSYAYIHAVAAKAGMACSAAPRAEDNSGVDARLTAWGPFPGGGYLDEVDLKVQLKATKQAPTETATHYSYFVAGVDRFNDLRAPTVAIPRILVVLFLPQNAEEWIGVSHTELVLRRCAYWVSLRSAPETQNATGATIHLPKVQVFDPVNLQQLMARLSTHDIPTYVAP